MANKKKKGGHRPPGAKRPAPKQQARKAAAPTASGGSPDAGGAGSKPRKPTQTERIEAARLERRRRQSRTRFLVVGVIVLAVALVGGVMLNNRRQAANVEKALEASGACEFDRDADDLSAPPNNHVDPGRYEVDPPAGGNHAPSAARAGIYEAGNVPPDGQLVHALEHGYIDLWYLPNAKAAEIDEMRAFAEERERDVLMMPRASMGVPFAATAWNRRLLCNSFDEAAFDRFFDEYVNEGPEKVAH